MQHEELEELIQRIRPEGAAPFFGIYDGATPAAYIRANREGLQLFARELLKASLTLGYSRDDSPIPLSRHLLPADGEVRLTHVRRYDNNQDLVLPEPEAAPGTGQKLAGWAAYLGAVVLLSSMLIGFYTIVRWLF